MRNNTLYYDNFILTKKVNNIYNIYIYGVLHNIIMQSTWWNGRWCHVFNTISQVLFLI